MANKVYLAPETALVWKDTDVTTTITLNNLAAGAGRQGDTVDLGSASRARRYLWIMRVQFATTPVVGERVRVYAKMSDGTRLQNDDGTADGAVSAEDKLRNLVFLGAVEVDEAATGVPMVAMGEVELAGRHFQPVVWNGTADNLVATNDLNDFVLQPVPDEVQ